MRKLIFIAFMVMSVCGYAQKYEVGTTTAVWKAPAAADFLHAKATGVKYVEVAFNQCYRGVPVDEVIPRIKEMKAKIDSADIEVWSIHLPFSRTLDISVLDDRLRKENVDFMAEMIELCAMFQPTCLVLHPSSEPIADSIRAQRIANASESIAYLKKYALPTQGNIKWGKLMQDLEKTGYKGVFMYEATKDHENNNVRPALERIAETFDKITDDYKTLK